MGGWTRASLAACALAGCIQEQRYVLEERELEMTESTPVTFVDEDDNEFFFVDGRYTFPISPPPDDHEFDPGAADPAPFPRAPWVRADDVRYELDWVLENSADETVEVVLVIDGINEFHVYEPMPPEHFHQLEERVRLEAGEGHSGSVRELELHEVAVDLATVVNGAPNSNLVVSRRSHSRTDGRVQMYIPELIPGLVGLRVGILTNEAVPLTLRFSVRATDAGERVAKRADAEWDLPDPAPFTPVTPED